MADPVPGNVVSRGVQFAVYRRLGWVALGKGYDLRHPKASYFDWNLPPLSDKPKKHDPAEGLDIDEDDEGGEGGGSKPKDGAGDKELVPVTKRWIYAFETGYGNKGNIGLLAREYHADDKGKLTFVDGAKRRLVDATDKSEPVGQPIKDAGLPHARQTEHCHYVFVATRGRLCKDAISDLEQVLSGTPESWGMPSIYKPVNLGDSLPIGPDGTPFAPVIDPLTLGETLGRSYRRALNWAINLSVPHGENPKLEEAKVTALKYQLGTMIRDSLLRDGKDPLEIRPHLVNDGELMLHFLAKHEGDLSTAQKQIQIQAAALIVFFKSAIWSQAQRWYFGPKRTGPKTVAAQNIGHLFLESYANCHRRLGETEIGRRYLNQLIHPSDGTRSWFFEPPEGSSEEERERAELWYQIRRKSITAGVVGIVEFGPALLIGRKVAHADDLYRRTLKKLFPGSSLQVLLDPKRRRLVSSLMKLSPTGRGVQLHYDNVQKELQHWVDQENEAHWPHGTKAAKAAELLSTLLAGIELFNLYDKLDAVVHELSRQEADRRESTFTASMRITIAGLDVIIAAKEPIREYGLHMASGTSAEKIIGKLLKPATFKIIGCVSSAIEAYVALVEAREAAERGERGVALGYRIVAGGAGLAAVGSFMGLIFANPATLPLLTAASLGLIVVGVAAVAIGYIVVACFTTSAWQSFAGHCIFGVDKTDGKTTWSGSEFHEWKENPEGLDLQIRALTAMLCGFSMNGEGAAGAGSSVRLAFGGLPPSAKLQIQFSLTFEDGTTATPGYLVDLERPGVVHHWGGPAECRRLEPFTDEGRLKSLIIAPMWPDGHRVVRSQCSAVIQYAPTAPDGASTVATGKHSDPRPLQLPDSRGWRAGHCPHERAGKHRRQGALIAS